MLYNIHNRLGKKIATVNMPACKGHTLKHREPVTLTPASADWQIGDFVKVGDRNAKIVDSVGDSNPPALFVEFL